MKWHPDKNPENAEATEIFQKISAAYALLCDLGEKKMPNGGTYKEDTFNFNRTKGRCMTPQEIDDLYRQVFGHNPPQPGPMRFQRRHGGFQQQRRHQQPRPGIIPKGSIVILKDIGNIPRYNGHHATVINYNSFSKRYLLRLLATGEHFDVHPMNVQQLR